MNQILSTTTPAAPSGVAPTEIPLGISGTIAPQLLPANIKPVPASIFTQNWGAYIGNFSVSVSNPVGSMVYSWNTDSPLPDHNFSTLAGDTPNFNIPRDLIQAFYSRQSKIDWILRFKPVKVSDCRVSMDFVVDYNSNTVKPYNELVLSNDTYHKHFDEQDDEFDLVVPMFWPTNNIPTYGVPSSILPLKPAFYPFTKVSVYIRNQYQPNLMQPMSFEMAVFAIPIVRELVGIHGPSVLFNQFNVPNTPSGGFPLPYFIINMSSTQSDPQVISPTLSLKGVETESTADVIQISESDFHNYVPTGLYIVIDTPLVKNSRDAIFGINIDGFIPTYIYRQTEYSDIYKNLMPLQVFPQALSFAKVFQEQLNLPIASLYASHRFIQGNVGIGIRCTSNTSQSGNLMVSQLSLGMRDYYPSGDRYNGLRFLNASNKTTDFTSASFQTVDLSLNRQLSLTPIRRNPNRITDLAHKIHNIQFGFLLTPELLREQLCFNNQFCEDWLIFCPASDWPDQNANQIRFDFYFDYSNVTFLAPLLPIIPLGPANFAQQILKYSDTFNEQSTANKSDHSNYLPG